jgi:hypothetical protein
MMHLQGLGSLKEVQVTCCGCGRAKVGVAARSSRAANRRRRGPLLASGTFRHAPKFASRSQLAAMSALRHLSRPRQFVCRQCIRQQYTLARGEQPGKPWAATTSREEAQKQWEEKAEMVRSGRQQSMLSLLEERGFVKDVAG